MVFCRIKIHFFFVKGYVHFRKNDYIDSMNNGDYIMDIQTLDYAITRLADIRRRANEYNWDKDYLDYVLMRFELELQIKQQETEARMFEEAA